MMMVVCVAVIKTGSAGLIAYRLMSRDSEWVWLQTSARVVYKNSKPEFIVAIHRHLAYVYLLIYLFIYLMEIQGEPKVTNKSQQLHTSK